MAKVYNTRPDHSYKPGQRDRNMMFGVEVRGATGEIATVFVEYTQPSDSLVVVFRNHPAVRAFMESVGATIDNIVDYFRIDNAGNVVPVA